MKYSTQRILTTHVGSLPRPNKVAELIFAKEREEEFDQSDFNETIADAVKNTVARQVEVGVDIVSDGEMSKISYATYIKERISGFEGDSPRKPPIDLQDFPTFLEKLARTGGTPSYKRPKCTGEIAPKNSEPLEADLNNFGILTSLTSTVLKPPWVCETFAHPVFIRLSSHNILPTVGNSYLHTVWHEP